MDNFQPMPGSIAVKDGQVVGGDSEVATPTGTNGNTQGSTEQQTQGNPEPTKETQETTDETQKLLAGKYKSEEELDKGLKNLLETFDSKEEAYKAIEKAKGMEQLKSNVDSKEPKSEAEEKAQELFGQKDLEIYYDEFLQDGKLSDKSREALKKKGVDPETAEAAIAGIKAQKDAYINKVFEVAGGEQEYKDLAKWISESGDQELLQTFEVGIIDLGQKAPKLAELIIKGAKAMKESASPELISGSMASGETDVYKSRDEFEKAVAGYMKSKDPKEEKKVWEKAIRSGYVKY